MATESFAKTFKVDRRSEKSMKEILTQRKPTLINSTKRIKFATKEDIKTLFSNGINSIKSS